jgi:hypothetical protein
MTGVSAQPYPANARWHLAEQVTDAVRRRFPARILAIGAHGALAHGDDGDELLRDTHLARLAEAGAGEFAALAREAWYGAWSAQARACRLAAWHETDAGLVALSDARVGAAVVDGLLTRTYFRDAPDAVRRTGLAGAPMPELAERLAGQAAELARRGRPVDGAIADLFT